MNPFFLAVGLEGGPGRQALAHNGLASHAQEWNREWHRAQARAWLHATPWPGLSQDHMRGSPGGSPAAHGMRLVASGPGTVLSLSAAHAVQQPRAYVRTGAVSAASLAPPNQHCFITPAEPTSVGSPQFEIAVGRGATTRQAPPERETVERMTSAARESGREECTLRIHVECADDGLHVWIGAHGDVAAVSVRAAAILAELRRSEHVHLAPLALVVCNGRTLYASGARAPSLQEKSA